ncbi:MAG: single-stranded-DNA-specific exonuclease RecJ [Clostridiales bacterium]|uniref:single-stranded-DNA-specific exonuclease RecJ n=1 Tax=Aminipila sp. TaxID=2060095 RepID=UPI001DAFCACB|nr:single-stranded-DNA-specific exonuclease RecJ [Aminipila sp.]MBE6034206.1 single-stranded-DNA-specific exonuclease RecJ [Clostridiales bacterium]
MNKINPIIIELLNKRGISEETEILEFLSDKPTKTYDPFLLHDLEAGVDLILSVINEKKKICIYGDYDADGITSVSIMLQFLSNLNADVTYYIPSRFEEGYGLNKEAVAKIKENSIDLIITVDCGSVSYEEVAYAKELGMDIIVTDHHSITDTVADCILINPKHPNCQYPFKYLAGCGVAFKLAQGIQRKAGLPKRAINELLDLVAIGTIGDIVPLVDENRTLVKYGMNVIRQGHRKGLVKLIEDISLQLPKIKSDNIAFGIVPHLNAAGRMMDAKIGVELLKAQMLEESQPIVEELIKNNRQRKKVQEDTFIQCEKIILENHREDLFFIVNCPDAHEGISGIVAGKLKDKYKKPTIILTSTGENYLKGTGRSIKKINLYNLLKEQEKLFERFGGHAGACGLLMKNENLDAFRQGISASILKMMELDPDIFQEELEIDIALEGKELNFELIDELEKLAPFGSCNEKPNVALSQILIKNLQYMGNDRKHARFSACCKDGSVIQSVLFNKAIELKEKLTGQKVVTLLGSPDISEWNGTKRIQFLVNDIW